MLITTTRTNKVIDHPTLGIGLFGNLMIDSNPFKCLILERGGVEIPVGVWPIQWMRSIHFQQIMPHVIVRDGSLSSSTGRTGRIDWTAARHLALRRISPRTCLKNPKTPGTPTSISS